MARKPSPKPKHVAHTKTGQKLARPPHANLDDLDKRRLAFETATQPYIPAPLPPDATRIGRPPTYRPDMCQVVLDDAALGHTLGATAAILGVVRTTLNDWASSYPEFGNALARAKSIRQRFYEGHAIDIVRRGGDSTRASMTLRGLVNVGGEDWKEKVTAEHNVTFSLAGLVQESMKLVGPTIDGQLVEQPNSGGSVQQD